LSGLERLIGIPKAGDIIYVETDLHVWRGADDFRGGKASISKVEMQDSRGKQVPWVEVVENPGTSYNWANLAKKQAELAMEFGDNWAHPEPDLRPEFNNSDDW
jgi:hypothetical protein